MKTFGTASTSKLKIVEQFGGQAIDYKQCDCLKQVRSATDDGADIVFDAIGGWNLVRSFRALRKGGRLIAYGFSSSFVGGKRDLISMISTATGCAVAYLLKLLAWNKTIVIDSIQKLKRQEPDWFRQDLPRCLAFWVGAT